MAIAPTPMPRSARPGGYPADFWSQLSSGLGRNSNALIGLGTGLLSAPTFSQGLAAGGQGWMQGGQMDDAYATQQKAEAERMAQLNETVQYLQQSHPDLAAMVESGMPLDQAWGTALKRMEPVTAEGAPANVREWEYYNALPDDATKAEYLRMKRSNPYLDIGTGFVQPDPVNPGSTAGPAIVKDNFTPAYDSAVGGAQGTVDVETQASFDSLNSKLPGLKTVVSELGDLAEKATYTTAGRLWDDVARETGNLPSEGALARAKYIAMVDNQVLPLLRDTFGAAFTQKEGESLRATLGNPNVSPPEKKAILEAFIEQKVRDLEALQSRLPGGQSGGTTSTGVPWSIEQ